MNFFKKLFSFFKKKSKSEKTGSESAKTDTVKIETEPVKPETEPVKSETEPVKSETEPVKSETEPVKPETEPIKPETEPIKPETEPETEPVKPRKDSPFKPEDLENTMYPEGIKDYEKQFDTTHKDSDGTQYLVTHSTDYPFPLSILEPENVSGYYYSEESEKTAIVLHFTAGYFMGDIATLIEQDSHVSVPYIIGRNGTVYQLYDPRYWSYHLGRGTIGGNGFNSKRSIGIELSNIGPLTRGNAKELTTIYGSKYCDISEKEFFTKLDNAYRQYTYYATFTAKQYESLEQLLSYLCSKYNIPKKFLLENKRYEIFSSDGEARAFKGICSHVNFRAYGKVDIGPAFNWFEIS